MAPCLTAKEQLSGFDFRNETFAVPSLQKLRLAEWFAIFGCLGFNSLEKLRSGLIEEISFALVLGLRYRHKPTLQFLTRLANSE
jgi:hypothetical protein